MMLDVVSQNLHDIAVDRAIKYSIAEAELLRAIVEIDQHKIYEKFDETHLTPYCVKYLNLSEDVAAMFVRVARKSQQVPELELAVQEGLQISKARVIASVISSESQKDWIEKARTLSKEKLEREVAAIHPSAFKPEKSKPVGHDRVRIEFEVTYEEAELLKRARELMSQKRRVQTQIGETVVVALKAWVEREDPVRKAERAQARRARKETASFELRSNSQMTVAKSPSSQTAEFEPQWEQTAALQSQAKSQADSRDAGGPNNSSESSTTRRPRGGSTIPAHVLHQVHLRDRGACRKRLPGGAECGRTQWTETHHVIPRAQGGPDTLENLITLCGAHHRQLHQSSA